MTTIDMTITDAGFAALSATLAGGPDVTIDSVKVGSGLAAADPSMTDLTTPIKTISSIDGSSAGNTTTIVALDESSDVYIVNEIGLFDGTTMIAVAVQASMFSKSLATDSLFVALNLAFLAAPPGTTINVTSDPTFSLPAASTTKMGIVRLATPSEADSGASNVVLTADQVQNIATVKATATQFGVVQYSSEAQRAGVSDRVISPWNFKNWTANETQPGTVFTADNNDLLYGLGASLEMVSAGQLSDYYAARAFQKLFSPPELYPSLITPDLADHMRDQPLIVDVFAEIDSSDDNNRYSMVGDAPVASTTIVPMTLFCARNVTAFATGKPTGGADLQEKVITARDMQQDASSQGVVPLVLSHSLFLTGRNGTGLGKIGVGIRQYPVQGPDQQLWCMLFQRLVVVVRKCHGMNTL